MLGVSLQCVQVCDQVDPSNLFIPIENGAVSSRSVSGLVSSSSSKPQIQSRSNLSRESDGPYNIICQSIIRDQNIDFGN